MQAAQIRIVSGQDEGRSFLLEEGKILVIGRSSPDPATRLTDLTVSRTHCKVESTGGRHILTNQSSHGTYVDGKSITRHVLEPGDVVQIGATKMAFFVGSVSEAATVPPQPPLSDPHLATLMPVSEFPFLRPPREPGEIGRLGTYRVLKVLGARRHGRRLPGRGPAARTGRSPSRSMLPDLAADASGRQRFLREAQAWPPASSTTTSSPSTRSARTAACRSWPWSSWRASRWTTGSSARAGCRIGRGAAHRPGDGRGAGGGPRARA